MHEPILDQFRTLYESRGDEVERFLAAKRAEKPPFITSSVDIRHSGFRIVPVDTNIFPAGFHLLSPAARQRAGYFMKDWLEANHPQAKSMLIVPENHTRNLAYLDNLAALQRIMQEAGLVVRIGSLAAEPGQVLELVSGNGSTLSQAAIIRDGDHIHLADGFTPDIILLNNDMTGGKPEILTGLAQGIAPPLSMGWYQRKKSLHFSEYSSLIREFCSLFDFDPWLFSAEFLHCGLVDFKERTNIERVARNIDLVLARAREKQKQYGCTSEPYVYVKADSGTYGMGIMTVRSGEEILELNKKERNKMQTIKEGAQNSEVIIQEGISTIDEVDGKPAESMIYLLDGIPIGGMYRINASRDQFGNLNAAGMEFAGMCDEEEDEQGVWRQVRGCNFRSFGIIAAIAALAAARENYDSFMLNL